MKNRFINFIYRQRIILFLAIFVISIAVCFPFISALSVDDIVNFSPKSLPLAAIIIIGIYCAKTILIFIPLPVLYISAGIIFPSGWAIIITYIGLFAETTIGYYIGRFTGKEAVNKLVEKNKKLKRFFDSNSWSRNFTCFVSRLLPLPADVINMIFGASSMHFPTFSILSLIGFSAAMIPFVLAGTALSDPLSARFIIPFSISIAVTICMMIVFSFIQKKVRQKQQNSTKA